jgi:hypothetical protein
VCACPWLDDCQKICNPWHYFPTFCYHADKLDNQAQPVTPPGQLKRQDLMGYPLKCTLLDVM